MKRNAPRPRPRRRWRRRRAGGYTLIELLVVLAIIGLLVGIVGPMAVRYLATAKTETARIQMKSLSVALNLYRIDLGRYPSKQEGLAALQTRPTGLAGWNGPYLSGEGVPADPWDRPYIYQGPGAQPETFLLSTLGADGAKGGEGENKDFAVTR